MAIQSQVSDRTDMAPSGNRPRTISRSTSSSSARARLFDRFAMMRYWFATERLSFDTFIHPDGLHLNDWSYACVAKVLASAIIDGAKPPVATARALPAPAAPATAATARVPAR